MTSRADTAKTVLIMTHSQENASFDLVADALAARGHRAARFDTDLFPTRRALAFGQDDGADRFVFEVTLADGSTDSLDLRQVSAVWNRRFYTAAGLPDELDPQLRDPSAEESQRSLLGAMTCFDGFCLDPLRDAHFARHKPLQLRIARQLGLAIPRTLVTNDPEKVRSFAADCPGGIICKMMTAFAVYDSDGNDHVVFTNALSDDDLANLEGLDLCPMTFQEKLSKAVELRVTVVGHKVFTAAIDSQVSDRATHDWRRDGVELLDSWQHHELPSEIESRVLALCTRLRLNYGAIDFILTPDGRYVFLEINPGGEFFWLEDTPGFPLGEALAEVLTEPAARRVEGRNPLIG